MTVDDSSETQEISLTIKRGLWDSLPRQLIISKGYLQFEDKSLRSDGFTRFDKSEIQGYRFGIHWIKGYQFIIGREYQIYIRDHNNEVIKIYFKTFYGYKKKELNQKYNHIINGLWKFYFNDIVLDHLQKFYNGQIINICNVKISQDHVIIQTNGVIKVSEQMIAWDKVGTKDYVTYYAIFSTDNPSDINQCYYYLKDWNVGILYSIMETILKTYRK